MLTTHLNRDYKKVHKVIWSCECEEHLDVVKIRGQQERIVYGPNIKQPQQQGYVNNPPKQRL